ncbi:unnamed protein product [Leptidea sinapis]|uniref:NADH:ubiquinone oxidoreductase intermediate-associated protein 30 domain-containing protein n=1 Tax=Leptidea sinapis TaxID=189913 RepID=A0A5E4PM75_9NEOP|nr:unnamed protein product [Leptidea sinapis]
MSLCIKFNNLKLKSCYRYAFSCNNLDYRISLLNQPNPNIIPRRELFWESNRKAGYNSKEKHSKILMIKEGFQELKTEFKLLGSEIKEYLEVDPLLIARPGETDLLWLFNEPGVLDKFVTTSDSDHNEGYSNCKLEMSPSGRALFHGYLDTKVPKDGRNKRAGYCSMRSKRVRKSFKRESTYNWHIYNTMVIKVRGDGRSYLLNISCEGYYDVTWNDIYHYVLFTRGGPYWQVAKIPFSKFVLGSKGRLQDKQTRIKLDRVTHFGISCGDKLLLDRLRVRSNTRRRFCLRNVSN